MPRHDAASTPSGLSQTGVTQSTMWASTWTASSDNVGVAGYGVYLAGVRIATTSSPGYTFASLTCGTTYTAGVDAYDAAGGRSARDRCSSWPTSSVSRRHPGAVGSAEPEHLRSHRTSFSDVVERSHG